MRLGPVPETSSNLRLFLDACWDDMLTITSIIVLHGLAAQSPDTWIYKRHSDNDSDRTNWLCDEQMLPAQLPRARVLTYEWNAEFDRGASTDIFAGYADTLLSQIHIHREDHV